MINGPPARDDLSNARLLVFFQVVNACSLLHLRGTHCSPARIHQSVCTVQSASMRTETLTGREFIFSIARQNHSYKLKSDIQMKDLLEKKNRE